MTAPPAAVAALDRRVAAWAASGAMGLSGPRPGGALGPPERLVDGVAGLGRRIEVASAALGSPVVLDWLALLGERAALDGLRAGGRTSCGGATRLLACRDGWLALSLARPDDLDLLPAWLALAPARPAPGPAPAPVAADDPLAAAVAARSGTELAEAAALVGLPVGLLGERRPDPDGGVGVVGFGSWAPPRRWRVVDLSALWAGPLCASLLALAGAEVTTVASASRPDAARVGSPELFGLLHAHTRPVTVDLASTAGRDELAARIAGADVVVSAARSRALDQLGLRVRDVPARERGPAVWVSITGHGLASPRVAFGDDAAVAGGLVVHDDHGPWFCADAVADPLAGLAAAVAALEAVATGRRALIDVAMAGVAAAHAGPTVALGPDPVPSAPPRARTG